MVPGPLFPFIYVVLSQDHFPSNLLYLQKKLPSQPCTASTASISVGISYYTKYPARIPAGHTNLLICLPSDGMPRNDSVRSRGAPVPSLLQRSVAYGQRAAKRQPGFGLIGEVISPFKMIQLSLLFRLGTGIAESRACVYG